MECGYSNTCKDYIIDKFEFITKIREYNSAILNYLQQMQFIIQTVHSPCMSIDINYHLILTEIVLYLYNYQD